MLYVIVFFFNANCVWGFCFLTALWTLGQTTLKSRAWAQHLCKGCLGMWPWEAEEGKRGKDDKEELSRIGHQVGHRNGQVGFQSGGLLRSHRKYVSEPTVWVRTMEAWDPLCCLRGLEWELLSGCISMNVVVSCTVLHTEAVVAGMRGSWKTCEQIGISEGFGAISQTKTTYL